LKLKLFLAENRPGKMKARAELDKHRTFPE
jgi:hypothetical protein